MFLLTCIRRDNEILETLQPWAGVWVWVWVWVWVGWECMLNGNTYFPFPQPCHSFLVFIRSSCSFPVLSTECVVSGSG